MRGAGQGGGGFAESRAGGWRNDSREPTAYACLVCRIRISDRRTYGGLAYARRTGVCSRRVVVRHLPRMQGGCMDTVAVIVVVVLCLQLVVLGAR